MSSRTNQATDVPEEQRRLPPAQILETRRALKSWASGRALVLLGCAVFLALGFLVITAGRAPMMDFRTAYYNGRCLLGSCDPYSQVDIEHLLSQEMPSPAVLDPNRIVVTKNIYLPSVIPFTLPLAFLPRTSALVIWLGVIAGSFILAAFSIWNVAAADAPLQSAFLLFFCLTNSILLLNSANPGGFVAPFCILAVVSFVHHRFVPIGIACFAIGLAFKPHDGGLIWLYFLLAGGVYRKRALQTLAVVAAFSVPALFWVMHISPHWLNEVSTNLGAFSGPGKMNDPRGVHGACMMTNLQTVTSFFWSNPQTYNTVAYVVCGLLILCWVLITLRARRSRENTWLALASISALSVLPIYHRQYDAKIVLLVIPAFAMLWARRDRIAWVALTITAIAFFFNGDFPWVVFLQFTEKLHLYPNGPFNPFMAALANFPVPLSLLVMGTFYLWVYGKSVLSSANANHDSEVAGCSSHFVEETTN